MIVAGVGYRSGCSSQEIADLVRRAESLVGDLAEALAAPAFKSGDPGLLAAAEALRLPLLLVERRRLEEAQPRCLTRSRAATAAVGLASAAEASALAAAGPAGRLLAPRITSRRAACALAGAPSP